MKTQNQQTGAGNTTAAQKWIRPHFVGEQRIVSHPDSKDFFAILDIYGDYYRSHHGYVMPFTEDAARAMIGLPSKFQFNS